MHVIWNIKHEAIASIELTLKFTPGFRNLCKKGYVKSFEW